MREVTNQLMYEVLKQLQAGQSDIKADVRDVKARLASIESYISTLHVDQTRARISLDDLVARVLNGLKDVRV